jgi:hypothetical protein
MSITHLTGMSAGLSAVLAVFRHDLLVALRMILWAGNDMTASGLMADILPRVAVDPRRASTHSLRRLCRPPSRIASMVLLLALRLFLLLLLPLRLRLLDRLGVAQIPTGEKEDASPLVSLNNGITSIATSASITLWSNPFLLLLPLLRLYLPLRRYPRLAYRVCVS